MPWRLKCLTINILTHLPISQEIPTQDSNQMWRLITDQIHDVLKSIPEVTEVDVRLVWSPAWTIQKMSRYARIALGIK